jgi:hypothetical protein
MRLAVLVVMVSATAAAASPRTTRSELAARRAWCARAIEVTKHFNRCVQPDVGVRAELADLAALRDSSDTDAYVVHRLTGMCVERLQMHLLTARRRSCRIVESGKQAAAREAFLKAWFGARTQPVSTGDPAVDRQVRAIARARDRLCACSTADVGCLTAARRDVDEAVMALPSTPAGAGRDAVTAMSDEASRCALNVEYGLFPSP